MRQRRRGERGAIFATWTTLGSRHRIDVSRDDGAPLPPVGRRARGLNACTCGAQAVADDESVAVIQASLRGKNSRREQSNKQVARAIANSNADELSRLLSKGAKPVAEALQQAIGSGVPALAEMLVRERSAWGIDAKQLAVWAKVQDAIAAAADEDNDEDVDVTSEEWQASVAEEVWAGADEAALADAKYAVRQVVELGCYAGERASAPEAYEPAFDSEVSPEFP